MDFFLKNLRETLSAVNKLIEGNIYVVNTKRVRRCNNIKSSNRSKINFIWRSLAFLEEQNILELNGKSNPKYELEQILIKNSPYSSRTRLKKRLINEGLLEYKCTKCGNIGQWNGELLSLQLEHKNGINNDNRLENLELLCPNCHSQSKTYSGKNRKGTKKLYYCKCGAEIKKNSKTCVKCRNKTINFKNRKVKNRPTKEKLLNEISEYGYRRTGRKYGVSDNAIRNWQKQYEKNL